ncbi:hypothetical protein ASD51_28885 [Streptomyces sp. Root55]|nr:hypothetical protein ASD51_28885 [Streptomyces sp. Root55]
MAVGGLPGHDDKRDAQGRHAGTIPLPCSASHSGWAGVLFFVLREGTFHGSRPATDISHSSGRHALTRVGHDHGQWPGARQE